MYDVTNLRFGKVALAGAVAAVTAIYVTHGRLSVAESIWHSNAVGITSPLAGCRGDNDSSCLAYPASHPLLYLEPISSMALTVAVDYTVADISQ